MEKYCKLMKYNRVCQRDGYFYLIFNILFDKIYLAAMYEERHKSFFEAWHKFEAQVFE